MIRWVLFLFIPCCGWATFYEPWIGTYGEVEWRNALRYQHFQHPYTSNDLFLSSSLSLAVKPEFSLEGEVVAANTRKQSGGIDHVRLTGRYVWEDDVAGDPLSITFGAGLIQTFDKAYKDLSTFHHGHSEVELFLSIGKEMAMRGERWFSRWWSVFAIGCAADRGSPWIRFNVHYDKRFLQNHEMSLYAKSLWGLGGQRLDLCRFKGYGPVQHQSIDLGISYTYLIEFFGSATLEYCQRVHAKNFPSHCHQFKASLLYTFGL